MFFRFQGSTSLDLKLKSHKFLAEKCSPFWTGSWAWRLQNQVWIRVASSNNSGKISTNKWLVASTQLKNVSQIGNLPQIGVKIKNIWNYRLDKHIKKKGGSLLYQIFPFVWCFMMISSISKVSSTAISPPRFTWWLRTTPAHHLVDFFFGGETYCFSCLLGVHFSAVVFIWLDFCCFFRVIFLNKKLVWFFWGALNCGNLFKIGSVSRKKGIHFQHTNSETGSPLLPLGSWLFFAKNPISVVWIPRKQTLRGLGKKMSPSKAGVLGNHHAGFMFNFGGAMKNQKWCCLEKRHLLENDCCNFNPQWPSYSETQTKLMIRVWWMRWSLQWLIIFPLTGFITDKHKKKHVLFRCPFSNISNSQLSSYTFKTRRCRWGHPWKKTNATKNPFQRWPPPFKSK